jgi:L-cystine transport system substrate-binding protein
MARNADRFTNEFNVAVKTAGNPVSDSPNYFVFNKQTGSQLQRDFDAALKAYKADGSLRELSIKWLGADFTPANE